MSSTPNNGADLALQQAATQVAAQPSSGGIEFTKDQIALIKRTICRPKNREATTDELALFIGQCKRAGLDPFARQVYAIFRKNGSTGQEEMSIQISIDAARLTAQRSGLYDGQTDTEWCGPDGVWRELWLESDPPVAARVGVYKRGISRPTYAVAHWGSYKGVGPLWKSMPEVMIAKCAEALALRKVFPAELSGLYTTDEIAAVIHADQGVSPQVQNPASKEDQQRIAAAHEASMATNSELQMQIVARGGSGENILQMIESVQDEQVAELVDWLEARTPEDAHSPEPSEQVEPEAVDGEVVA